MSPSRPHDKYFRRVFSNTKDAASLLRACVPEPLARVLRWSTLTLLPGRFVSPDWRDSQADLLFSVEREPQTDPVLLYVLLEHQSSPDPWMPLRLLIDQTEQRPESVPGELAARLAQIAMMAAFREARENCWSRRRG